MFTLGALPFVFVSMCVTAVPHCFWTSARVNNLMTWEESKHASGTHANTRRNRDVSGIHTGIGKLPYKYCCDLLCAHITKHTKFTKLLNWWIMLLYMHVNWRSHISMLFFYTSKPCNGGWCEMAWVTAFERCPLPQLFEQHREAINVLRQDGNQWTRNRHGGVPSGNL